MKIKTAIIALFILLPSICLAEIKYNPWTGQWESAPRDSTLKYNPWDGDWSMREATLILSTILGLENGITKDK